MDVSVYRVEYIPIIVLNYNMGLHELRVNFDIGFVLGDSNLNSPRPSTKV